MYLSASRAEDCYRAGQKALCESRTGPKEAEMYDSFSEGPVYYGRALLVAFGAIALAVIAAVL